MGVTWNPADKHANVVLSNGDLTASANSTSWKSVRATDSKSSGKWYFECKVSSGTNLMVVGLALSSASIDTFISVDTKGWAIQISNNSTFKRFNNNPVQYAGVTANNNDIYMVALDLDAGKIWYGKNGTWFESGNPQNGTNEAYASVTGPLYPAISPYDSNVSITARFQSQSLSYSPPNGFSAWDSSSPSGGLIPCLQIEPLHNSFLIAHLGL